MGLFTDGTGNVSTDMASPPSIVDVFDLDGNWCNGMFPLRNNEVFANSSPGSGTHHPPATAKLLGPSARRALDNLRIP
jgi:hypothetical protein